MMIVMDCLHFANYFVPLIYNSGALTISAESRAAANCISQKSIAAVLILQKHKRLDSPHQLGHIALNTNRMMQCRGLTEPYRAASSTPTITVGNKWECERAVGGVRVSSPTGLSGFWCRTHSHREPPLQPLLSPCRGGPPPILKTSVQNMMNYHMSRIISPPA